MNTKKKRTTIICLIVLVIAAAAGTAYFFKSAILKRLSPERYMEAVFVNTIASLDREVLKLPDPTAITDSPYEFLLSLGLKDYKLDQIPEDFVYTMEALKLLTFTSNSKVDRGNGKLSNDLQVLAGGIGITDFGLFFTDDMYAVSCEMLTDKTVTINPKTFVSDWNTSPLLPHLTNLTMPDIVKVDGLNKFIFSEKSFYRNIDEDLSARLKSESVVFIKSAEVKYKGAENGYDIVEATYSKESFNKLYRLIAESAVGVFEDRFSAYLKLASDYDEAYIALHLIEQYKNDILSVSFNDALTVTYFIDGKDLIRRLETADMGITSDFGDARAQINVDLSGDKFLSDHVGFEIKLASDEETTISVTNILTDSGSRQLHHNLNVDFTDDTGKTSHTYSADWMPDGTGDFSMSYAFDSAADTINFSLNGQLSDDNDAIRLTNGIMSLGYNENLLELKTGYSIKRYDSEVVFDDINAFSFFDINIFELNSIYMKAQNFLYSF